MSNKVELNELTQVVHNESNFLVALNANLKALQKAINDTLSRTGVVPNQMEQVLDMNGKRIINLGKAIDTTDALSNRDLSDLIAKVDSALARIDSLAEETRQSLQQYINDYVMPVVTEAVDIVTSTKDDIVATKQEIEGIYNTLLPLVQHIDKIIRISEMNIAAASDVIQGSADNKIVTPKALKDAGIFPLTEEDKEGLAKAVRVTLPVADWDTSTKTITVAVEDITPDTPIFVTPDASLSNLKAYGDSFVYASGVSTGTVTFSCETLPEADIEVLVGINAAVASLITDEVIGDINTILDNINGEII